MIRLDKREKEIMKKFKHLFKYKDDLKKSLMQFGFECDSGWYDLIERTLERISKIVKEKKMDGFYIVQIKEKFGLLRIYYEVENEYKVEDLNKIDDIIQNAIKESANTCELCGATENVHRWICSSFWIKTLCDKCASEIKTCKPRE